VYLLRWERGGKNQFDHINVQGMIFDICRAAVDLEIQPVDITSLFFIRKIKFSVPIYQELITERRFIIFICIWPDVEPNEIYCVRRIVGVFDFFKCIQAVVLIVKRYIDRIIYLLLPVVQLAIGNRQLENTEDQEKKFSHRWYFNQK